METLPEQVYADLKAQLPALTDALKQGVEYGGDLFHRFIVYDIAVHVAGLLFALLCVLLSAYLAHYFEANAKWDHRDEPENFEALMRVCCIILLCIFLAGTFVATLVNGSTILKDIFVPELRVIEIISNLNAQ